MVMDREKVADHFTDIVAKETQKLNGYLDVWNKILENTNDEIPEDVRGDIYAVIGKTELIKKERFRQFEGLINDCKNQCGEKEITSQDLQGFWDMVYVQVEDLLKQYDRLEKLQKNNWQSLSSTNQLIHKEGPKAQEMKKLPPKKPVAKKPQGNSSLRAHIEAARRKMMNEQNKNDTNEQNNKGGELNKVCIESETKGSRVTDIITECKDKENTAPTILGKRDSVPLDKVVFDAGFFRVESPAKQQPPMSDKRQRIAKTEQRVLASSVLKERVQESPLVHKDYSSCMRVTRSMKAKMDSKRRLFKPQQ